MILLDLIAAIMIVGLFIYLQLRPYQQQMFSNYQRIFNKTNKFIEPIFNQLNKFIKPIQIGSNIKFASAPIIVLIILLAIILL